MELMHKISAARPAFFTPAQREEWENTAVKAEITALRKDIALAEAKAQRLQASIETRKKSLARLEAQAILIAPAQPRVAAFATNCR